jgi:K+-transporting ATPase ATPase A chain
MSASGDVQIGLYLLLVLLLVKPLGWYMARVYQGEPIGLDRIFGPVERAIYRLAGVRPEQEMDWRWYAVAMLLFSGAVCCCCMRSSGCRAGCPSTRRA